MYWNIANDTAVGILNILSDKFEDQINKDELVALFGGEGIETLTR